MESIKGKTSAMYLVLIVAVLVLIAAYILLNLLIGKSRSRKQRPVPQEYRSGTP